MGVKLLLRAISLPTDRSPTETLVRLDALGFTAWASQAANDSQAFTREDLIEHHRIVCDIHQRVEGCLPARFPRWFADESELRQRLAARGDEFTRQLVRVRGCSELAVTGVWTSSDEVECVKASTPGRQYLLERQRVVAGSERQRARARDIEERLIEPICPHIREVDIRLCPSPAIAFSIAILVSRGMAGWVMERVSCGEQDVRILVNGPWPPYSFAGVASD
jgi:hypothetical protein